MINLIKQPIQLIYSKKLPKDKFIKMSIDEFIDDDKSKPEFNVVYFRINLPKIKDVAFVINFDQYKSIRTHWIGLYLGTSYNVTYFDRFGAEQIPKEIENFIENKNITRNICIIQAYDSIMCGYFCIEFINFMLKEKTYVERMIKKILKHFH